jgi:hypothetical protein
MACHSNAGSQARRTQASESEHEVRTLSSGKQVTVFEVTTQELSGQPTLVITYATKVSLNDVEDRMREADELWPDFQEDAEKSGLSRAFLSQASVDDEGRRTGGLAGVAYAKNEDGVWCRITGVPYEGQESWCFPPKK